MASTSAERLGMDTVYRQSELRRLAGFLAVRIGIFAVIYIVLLGLSMEFPYLQAGADAVTQKKHELARSGQPFQVADAKHVAVFGDSRVLSGFIPAQFDRELSANSGTRFESYNFGLPGDPRFANDLQAMIRRGVVPDVVLLTAPWPETSDESPSFFRFWENDQEIIDRLFPFRKLPRDLLILTAMSGGSPSRFRATYENNRESLEQVTGNRGYYFLARMSHFRSDELPAGLRLQTDTPTVPKPRRVVARGPVFEQLAALFGEHHIRCVLIPTYYREYEYAPAPSLNSSTVKQLSGREHFEVLGPDYYLFPNSYFSDPRHLNPRGAKAYTHLISELMAKGAGALTR